jgi:energy-coupling factor transporter ATP-binding protein EcfA2
LPVIQITDLSYAYPPLEEAASPIWVLRGLNLGVEKGEFVAIMGPAGSGKTTLALALNGIVPQSTGGHIRGNVVVAGMNTKRHEVHDLARHVGLVFQEPENQLFNRDLESEIAFGLENLGLPRDEIGRRIDWALGAVEMGSLRHRSPFQLSGGQKQRVAIAAVLAMKPQVLVLDEPTASLDWHGQSQLINVISQLRNEIDLTTVLISNDPEWVLAEADRVMVMEAGEIVIAGDPGDILGDVERLREIGIRPPQMADLAHRMRDAGDGEFRFLDLDAAYDCLTHQLSRHRERD